MVDEDVESHLRQMRAISEGRAEHGGGSAYEQATRYYLEHLSDACARRARDEQLDLPPRVDLLICMTGMSPRPVVLAFKILQPARLVLITSDAVRDTIDVVHDHVVATGLLRPSEFVTRSCVPTDPLSIYRVVREEVDVVTRRHDGPIAAYIDITGGRKVMGASAALAAWQLNLGLSYVDGDFDPVLKQAVPGSDRMLVLDNPTSLFGEQEMKVATQAFASGDFEVARSRFAVLAERLVQPGLARFVSPRVRWRHRNLEEHRRCLHRRSTTMSCVSVRPGWRSRPGGIRRLRSARSGGSPGRSGFIRRRCGPG